MTVQKVLHGLIEEESRDSAREYDSVATKHQSIKTSQIRTLRSLRSRRSAFFPYHFSWRTLAPGAILDSDICYRRNRRQRFGPNGNAGIDRSMLKNKHIWLVQRTLHKNTQAALPGLEMPAFKLCAIPIHAGLDRKHPATNPVACEANLSLPATM
jgi:hypothetical protein